jgi:centrosomal protein CEP104
MQQVQLLSHQSKIATRVELFVGRGKDYFSAKWKRLGYLSLDSNERSGFKARELKSVYIDAKGHFLKLLVHKCHVNSLNLFNQVRTTDAPHDGGECQCLVCRLELLL